MTHFKPLVLVAALLIVAALLPVDAAKWGYLVNETDLATYISLGSPTPEEVQECASANGTVIMGVVRNIQLVIDFAIPTGIETWEINHDTKWKHYNNMQWFMKPYPNLAFQSPEVTMNHVTVWHSQGDFYLVGAHMA